MRPNPFESWPLWLRQEFGVLFGLVVLALFLTMIVVLLWSRN